MAHGTGEMAARLRHLRRNMAGFTRGDRRAIDERKVCIASNVDRVQVARECGFGTADPRVEIPRKTKAWFALGAVGGEFQQCAHGSRTADCTHSCAIALAKAMAPRI